MPTEYWVLTGVIILAIVVDIWCYFRMRDEVADLREDVEALSHVNTHAIGFMAPQQPDQED